MDRWGPMVNEPKLDGMCNESWGRHADFTVIVYWGFMEDKNGDFMVMIHGGFKHQRHGDFMGKRCGFHDVHIRKETTSRGAQLIGKIIGKP